MAERPILFSAPMVQAILAGTKTQTRRVVKGKYWFSDGRPDLELLRCPYGVPGDRLWVRETFWVEHDSDNFEMSPAFDCGINLAEDDWARVWYCATDHEPNGEGPNDDWAQFYSKRPSIHMPRWASRITLEVTGMRVERVQDISEDDVYAEGVGHGRVSPQLEFQELWDSINARRGFGWAVNPWVWCVEFRRLTDG